MYLTRPNRKINARGFLLLVFFVFLLNGSAQKLSSVIRSVERFYDQKTLSYSFEKRWYVNDGRVLWRFDNDVVSYKTQENVYYFHEYYIKGKEFRYDNVKNRRYYGTNMRRQQYHYFKNYLVQERDVLDGNDSQYVFCSSAYFRRLMNNRSYIKKLSSDDSCYLLELHDTTEVESNLPGVIMRNKRTKYHISKKDGRILRAYHCSSGLGMTDSVIFTYIYYKTPKSKIIEKIDSFVPLEEVDESARRAGIRDSSDRLFQETKVFPLFNLPDTSGKIYTSGAISARYVLVDFWYKNCGPCLLNMKYLQQIRSSFRREDLEVIALNIKDRPDEEVKQKIKEFDTTYLWLFEGQNLDVSLHIYAYPSAVIYDAKTSQIVYRAVGAGANQAEEIIRFLKVRLEL